jgi:hypothetical protein
MSFIETFEKADINISTSGDNTIIAAPGDGKYLAIDFVQYMVTNTTTVQHKDGAANYGGPYPLAAQQAVTIENSMQNEHGVLTCSNNSPFIMNLSGNVQTGGIIRYRIVGK